MNAEKLKAVSFLCRKTARLLEEQLTEQIEKIYQKVVPQPARLYIEEVMKDNPKQGKKAKNRAEIFLSRKKLGALYHAPSLKHRPGSAVREGAV